MSSAYLRLLILQVLISTCDSSRMATSGTVLGRASMDYETQWLKKKLSRNCFAAAAAAAKSLQSCPTLCDPIDGSPPDSPVPGILQARTLEWVAISFSNA